MELFIFGLATRACSTKASRNRTSWTKDIRNRMVRLSWDVLTSNLREGTCLIVLGCSHILLWTTFHSCALALMDCHGLTKRENLLTMTRLIPLQPSGNTLKTLETRQSWIQWSIMSLQALPTLIDEDQTLPCFVEGFWLSTLRSEEHNAKSIIRWHMGHHGTLTHHDSAFTLHRFNHCPICFFLKILHKLHYSTLV